MYKYGIAVVKFIIVTLVIKMDTSTFAILTVL